MAPEQLRQQVELRGTEALGRPVRLQQLQLSLLPLRLTLQGLVVEAPSAAAPSSGAAAPALLKAQHVAIEVDPWSLWHREPVVTQLHVEGLQLHLSRSAEGRWSVGDLQQRFQPKPSDLPSTSPAMAFTLMDLAVREGRLTFEDGLHRQRHEVTGLQATLPWWSNRPGDADKEVQAHLALQLNGAPVGLQARAWPMRKQPALQAQLTLAGLALAPWWPWLPADLPLRPQQGHLDAELSLRAEQAAGGDWQLAVSGPTALNSLSLVSAAGAPMASWRRLEVALQDVRPLQKRVHLGHVRLEGGQVQARRDARGRLEWAALATGPAEATARMRTGQGATPGPPDPAQAPAQPAADGAPGWDIRTGPVAVEGLQVHWTDQLPRPAVRAAISALDLKVDQLSWPVRAASAFQLEARVQPPARLAGQPAAVALALQGTASDQAAQVSWRVGALALAPWRPYLERVLHPALQGTARAVGELEWAAGPRPRLRVALRSLQLDDFQAQFPPAQAPPVTWRSLVVEDLRADLLARRVGVGQISWREPAVQVRRARDGLLRLAGVPALDGMLVPPNLPPPGPSSGLSSSSPPAPSRAAAAAAGSAAPRPALPAPDWRVNLARLRVSDGRVDAIDEQVPSDLEPGASWALRLRPVSLEVDRLVWPPSAAPAELRLDLQWPQPGAETGDAQAPPAAARLAGSVRLDTPGFQGTVQMERWPLHRFEPQWLHLGVALPVRVDRAELGLDGRIDLRLGPQGLETSGGGSVRVADVRVLAASAHAAVADGSLASLAAPRVADPSAAASAEELATWNLLQLQDLRWQVVPGQPPRVELGLLRLADFFARLQVTEAGRLNLQDVTAPRPGAAGATPAPMALPATDAAKAPSAAPGPTRWPLDLTVVRTELVNGRVDFIDRFIRPNYAADLTELNGSLGRFESGSTAMAPVELRGRAARTAMLEIRGAVNPMASPLMLDLSARATDLELAPLSPYGGKYVGYAIERGKLSVDLSYRIEADGRLEARNQVILNQLTFGERIDSPHATGLPVRLALALLADRNGVIDVNLPISGSINEPQFSLMGLVFKMIGNLLVKVVTAPFAWLAGSDRQDLSVIAFDPGAAQLVSQTEPVLDQLFRALSDRPLLRMTITGMADHEGEGPALRAAGLAERLLVLQRREAARAARPAPADSAAPALPALPARGSEAYAALIRRLYDDTPLPGKPRNLLGLATALPVAQMEALLLGAVPVNETSARELALQRALAVRDALIARGLAAERLFLAAPQVGPGAQGGQGGQGGQAVEAAVKPQARMAITGP